MSRPLRAEFPPPRLITTSEALAELCQRLRQERFVTVDTEFMRERTYWPELCVVQLAGTDDVAVVDTEAGIDLAPLGALLADQAVMVWLHQQAWLRPEEKLAPWWKAMIREFSRE